MTISSVCRSRHGAALRWRDDVRSELPEPRRPPAVAALRRRESRERRRVLAELAALLARNPFLEP